MKWYEATTLQLCHIVMYDETATEEDKRAAGKELFSRIGVDRNAMQSIGMQKGSN